MACKLSVEVLFFVNKELSGASVNSTKVEKHCFRKLFNNGRWWFKIISRKIDAKNQYDSRLAYVFMLTRVRLFATPVTVAH